jgi:hypothetical protein
MKGLTMHDNHFHRNVTRSFSFLWKPTTAFLAIVCLNGPSLSHADIINVAFQATAASVSGPAAIGAAGDVWNTPLANNIWGTPLVIQNVPLVNTAGAITGVSVTVNNFYGGFTAQAGLSQTPNPNLTQQYIFDKNPPSPASIVLKGLTPNGFYDLYVLSSMDPLYYPGPPDHGPRPALISANAAGPVYVSANPTATTFSAGVNYAPFIDLEADATGTITITAAPSSVGQTANSKNEIDINGFQLAPASVPEPSSFCLSVVGFFALLLLCRRAARMQHAPASD